VKKNTETEKVLKEVKALDERLENPEKYD